MNRHWFILLTALGLTLLLGACHRGSRTVTHNVSSDSLTIEEIEAELSDPIVGSEEKGGQDV